MDELTVEQKRQRMEPGHAALSIARQCELLGLPRSDWYYLSRSDPALAACNQAVMNRIDCLYTDHPSMGVRMIGATLKREGLQVNVKRVRRLMRLMGLEAVYPKPRLSLPHPRHRIYPYLLRGLAITRPDQVWASDITYIPLACGWGYLCAVMDWHSRFVLSWWLSNTLDVSLCMQPLESALALGRPEIFNTDQGSQFTSEAFTGRLKQADVRISMDGRGRALDNVFIERLWRSVKYDDVYLRGYETLDETWAGLNRYFAWYNDERPHQGLDGRTPAEVYRSGERAEPNRARCRPSGRPTGSLRDDSGNPTPSPP